MAEVKNISLLLLKVCLLFLFIITGGVVSALTQVGVLLEQKELLQAEKVSPEIITKTSSVHESILELAKQGGKAKSSNPSDSDLDSSLQTFDGLSIKSSVLGKVALPFTLLYSRHLFEELTVFFFRGYCKPG